MNTVTERLLVPYYVEYLLVTSEFLIQEFSSGVQCFAEIPNHIRKGKDIRLAFPELIAEENCLTDILQGRRKSFELTGIVRFNAPNRLYLDLYITAIDDSLVLLLKNATERMILEQRLIEQNNEKNILLNSLYTYQNYHNQVLASIQDVLIVTNFLGDIITVNQAALDLFEYSHEELINEPISNLIIDSNFLLQTHDLRKMVTSKKLLKNNSVIFQSKTGKKIIISCSSSIIETNSSDLCYFLYTGQDITENQIAVAALRESEERFKIFMNNSPTVAFIKDALGRIVYINNTFEQRFNVKFTDLYLKDDFDWLPEDLAKDMKKNDSYVLSTGNTIQVVETVPKPDGCLSQWLVFKFLFKDSKGEQLVGGVAVDLTEQKLLEQQLFEEKELAQVTLKSIADAVITTDVHGKVKYLNPVAEKLTGWSFASSQGKPISKIFKVVNEITHERVKSPVAKVLSLGYDSSVSKEYILITRDSKEVSIDYSIAPIHSKNGAIIGAVIVFQDVSHKRSMARQLSWQATHDALTRLLNRSEFERRLSDIVSGIKPKQEHALFFLDLDRFKIVNDTCGHIAGDELLRQVTVLFQESIRCSDTLARLGGDEFGIVLEACPIDSALRIAKTILKRLKEFRFVWQDKNFNIGASIGLVAIKADGLTMSNLLSAADAACYIAKNKGRNRVHVYQADDSEFMQVKNEMQWATQISQALEKNSFSLYYQPIVPTSPSTSKCKFDSEYYEVLLRLIDQTGNEVLPMVFIPAAERYNLMPAIDRWVISTLFANIATYRKQRFDDCDNKSCYHCTMYGINLSGASINDDNFMEFVREQLHLYQIPPQTICFEITETHAVANLVKAANFIRALKELGCRFALDDFGSGMSSWGYLKNMSVDYLKIDGSFIKHIPEEKINMAMVEAINKIGHLMGIQTIAEYVESKEIIETLKEIGVDYVQGYGISKPYPLFTN